MDIERLSALLAVLLPVLLAVVGVLAVVLWRWNGWDAPALISPHKVGDRRARLTDDAKVTGTWLALTAVVLWVGFIAAFFILHAILFTFGREATFVALVVGGALLVATPVATGIAVRRRAHHS